MPSRAIVRYAAAVVLLWVFVIVYKLPTLQPTKPQRHAVAARVDRRDTDEAPAATPPPEVVRTVEHGRNLWRAAVPTTQRVYEDEQPPATPRETLRRRASPVDADNDAAPVAAATPSPDGKWPRVSAPTNLDPRREAVVKMLRDSWEGYRKHAWGKDEFAPISKRATNWGNGKGIGATIVDALDTLLIAGLDEQATEALEWVESELTFDQDIKLSGFETTIRVLGGLLSAYQITGRKGVLKQAQDLGRRLVKGFDTPSGVPHNYVNLLTGQHEGAAWNGGASILSELGSLQMEHYTLSEETGEPSYFQKARRAVEVIAPACGSGYCPRQFHGAHSAGGTAGLGSFGDSFYEYLLKQWVLSGKQDTLFKSMWDKAARHTLDTSMRRGGVFIPNGHETGGTMEHLACFSGGLFALSYLHTGDAKHLEAAQDIAATCRAMYAKTATHLAPDVANVDDNGGFHASDAKYILRPETVETYFYLWKVTKDPKYRDWGYDVVEAINKHLKIPGSGYAGAADVYHVPVRHNDNMETFWFAETLKYLYLLFSEDELIDLKQWVFNTEAHPLRVQKPSNQ